jgi:hypothetical protein
LIVVEPRVDEEPVRRAGFNLLDRLQPWSASSHGLETFDCTHWISFVSPDEALLERLAASFAERRLTIHVSALYGLAEADTALDAAVAGRPGGGIVVDPRR